MAPNRPFHCIERHYLVHPLAQAAAASRSFTRFHGICVRSLGLPARSAGVHLVSLHGPQNGSISFASVARAPASCGGSDLHRVTAPVEHRPPRRRGTSSAMLAGGAALTAIGQRPSACLAMTTGFTGAQPTGASALWPRCPSNASKRSFCTARRPLQVFRCSATNCWRATAPSTVRAGREQQFAGVY